ncbi:hypothetical protein T440DRAFT_547057 [Plenodomus tracheiphilus IPT5]|uniref:DUF6594 domain-containing protein n=1 Tax=Plenodomus tracheiphilus IPT5 TaxID=1408161 RepID=A0A6A7ARJ3_9PLEO|nr:hypothetical protein T440DRAFT_547057 [Plenodomus tracheiphilus IPT5]
MADNTGQTCKEKKCQITKTNILTSVVEDNPGGYPRFTALIASHDHFHICRRFTELRSRLLLIKQDKLSDLERQLRHVDDQETDSLRLATCREDDNPARNAIILQIDYALKDYDNLVVRNEQILRFEAARSQAISSLRNWTAGNPTISRAETAYLDCSHDLFSVACTDDMIMTWLETFVEKIMIQVERIFPKQRLALSRDPRVHVFSKLSIARTARFAMAPCIVILLLAPAIICSYLHSLTARLLTIVVAASIFIAVMTGSTRAKATELVMAGATYTTVLIVFIASNTMTNRND